MGLELLAVGLWSGIVSMDTTAAMQIMISRPLFSCMVTGLILGDYQLGLMLGIYLELIWIHELPVGAAYFAEGNVGSVAATSIAVYAFQSSLRLTPSIAFALLSAVIISHLGGSLVAAMRSLNSRLFDNLLSDKELTFGKVERSHFTAIALAFLLGFIITPVSAILLGKILVPALIGVMPVILDEFLAPVSIAFLGVGSGILMYMFARTKKYWLMILIGIGLALLFLLR